MDPKTDFLLFCNKRGLLRVVCSRRKHEKSNKRGQYQTRLSGPHINGTDRTMKAMLEKDSPKEHLVHCMAQYDAGATPHMANEYSMMSKDKDLRNDSAGTTGAEVVKAKSQPRLK